MTIGPILLAPPWVKDPLYKVAKAVPSLDLNFARDKALGGLVTFTRASSGTFVGSDGVLRTATNDAPRFDHNPTTGESLGLLVEEQRTNGYVNSENLTGLVGSAATTAASVVVTPSANTNAISLTEDGTNAQHNTSLVVPVTSGTAVSISIFAKLGAGSRGLIIRGLAAQFTSIVDTRFDLVNGTVAAGTGSIQRFPDNWYRCTFIATPTATSAGASIRLHLTDGATITYQGDGASSILLYGPQAENGAFPTSYIPTTGTTATRSADVASITGTNFSSWYRQDEGTVFADVSVLSTSKANQTISFNDGTANNRFELRPVGSVDTMRTDCIVGGVQKYSNTSFALTGQRRIGALAVKANDFRMQSGATGINAISDAVPTVDRLYLNYATFVGGEINGTIRRLTYWPQRLSNSTLQQVTQ